jgi:uncharacterized protein YidB (DUF937 family)
MGLLDGVMGSMAGGGDRRPGLGSTVAAGAVLALLVKGVRDWQQSHPPGEGRSFNPQDAGQAQAQPAAAGGGLGGMLGGLGGGGLGGLLGGLGGAGALGALVGQLQQGGLGDQVASWVGHGQNAPVAPNQLANALGDDNVAALQQQTGMPRDQLLSQLADHLPDAIHQLTPQGRLPDEGELHQIASQAPPG